MFVAITRREYAGELWAEVLGAARVEEIEEHSATVVAVTEFLQTAAELLGGWEQADIQCRQSGSLMEYGSLQ